MKKIYQIIILTLLGLPCIGQSDAKDLSKKRISYSKSTQCSNRENTEYKCDSVSTYAIYDSQGQMVSYIQPNVSTVKKGAKEIRVLNGYGGFTYEYDSYGNEISKYWLSLDSIIDDSKIPSVDLSSLPMDTISVNKYVYLKNVLMEEQWGRKNVTQFRKYFYTSDSTYYTLHNKETDNEVRIIREEHVKTPLKHEKTTYEFKVVGNPLKEKIKMDTIFCKENQKYLTEFFMELSDSSKLLIRNHHPSIDFSKLLVSCEINNKEYENQLIFLKDKNSKFRYRIILRDGKLISSQEFIYKKGFLVKRIHFTESRERPYTKITTFEYLEN